jgi:TRAP-type C4-dicarboxylate transport system substrate-binding protein
MRRKMRLGAIMAAVAASAVLAACSAGSPGDKAGGDPAPVTLRIGTDDGPERPGAAQVDQFARQVRELSNGRIRIEPVWYAAGKKNPHDWDQVVARKVVRGEFDMGLIPARAWDTEGVTTLRALHAPFLVTSDQLLGQVVKGELASDMLAGLDGIGVTGLALLPEGLRHVFGFGDPPLEAADFDGMVVRVPTSRTTYAVYEALGAKPDDFGGGSGARFEEGVKSGQINAAESSFALGLGLPAASAAAGNITFFPKVNSLVVNTDVVKDLSDEQRAVLRDAAARTVDWAIKTTRSDAELAKQYCANGGRVVVASQADVAELQQAVQPVYDELERDAATKAMIARIRSLSSKLGPDQTAVRPCQPGTAAQTASEGGTAESFPAGIYRMEMPVALLLQAGVDQLTAHQHAGIWTLTFKNGEFNAWSSEDEGQADPTQPTCPGSTYSVQGGRVSIHLGPSGPGCGTAAGKVLFSAMWALQGDQLRFLDVRSGHGSDLLIQTLFGQKSFTKIG